MRYSIIRALIVGSIFLGLTYTFLVHHRYAGSLLTKRRHELINKNADVVMVGNSILRAGVLPHEFEGLTGKNTVLTFSNGAASAWWYLYIKNVVCAVKPAPKVAMIFFRDHFLTDPTFRTDGKFRCPLRTLSTPDEPLLRDLLNPTGIVRLWDSPWTWVPQETKNKLDNKIGKLAGKMGGLNKHQQRESLGHAFSPERMVPEWINEKQISSEQVTTNDLYDFEHQLSRSFLPAIISELKAKKIQPIFVRMKRRSHLQHPDSTALNEYMAQLERYLKNEGAVLIDFTQEKSILEEHYGPGDHLNLHGRTLFTRLLADRLISEVAFSGKGPDNAPSPHKPAAA